MHLSILNAKKRTRVSDSFKQIHTAAFHDMTGVLENWNTVHTGYVTVHEQDYIHRQFEDMIKTCIRVPEQKLGIVQHSTCGFRCEWSCLGNPRIS